MYYWRQLSEKQREEVLDYRRTQRYPKPDHHGEENPPPEWKYYEIWMQIRAEMYKK